MNAQGTLWTYKSQSQGLVILESIDDPGVMAFTVCFVEKRTHYGVSPGDIRTDIPITILHVTTRDEYNLFKSLTRLEIPFIL